METLKPTDYTGKIVSFTPRGSDVEINGKVIGSNVSTLDNQTYLKIKAEDGKTYTKQIKYVQILNETAKANNDEIPETLLREIKKLANPSREKEIENLVKKYFKKEFAKMLRAIQK